MMEHLVPSFHVHLIPIGGSSKPVGYEKSQYTVRGAGGVVGFLSLHIPPPLTIQPRESHVKFRSSPYG